MIADRRSKKAVLDALSLDNVDDAAVQLAALRAYATEANDAADESSLGFDAVRNDLGVSSPWHRRGSLRWTLGGLGVATATAAILAAILPQTGLDEGARIKGEQSCCGAVTLRVGLLGEDGVVPLPSRVVTTEQELAYSVVLSEPGWASVYDVHLATRTVHELPVTHAVGGPSTTRAAPESFFLSGEGRHVLLLLVTAEPRTLNDAEVVDLLASLADQAEPAVDGHPCSVDLYPLEVQP